jgi:hypothetical protein
VNGRRAKRIHQTADELRAHGLDAPCKARRFGAWTARLEAGRREPRPLLRWTRAGVPLGPKGMPGRGPAKVGRSGPSMPSRVNRSALLAGRRGDRQRIRWAWRERQRRRKQRKEQRAA